MTRNPEIPIAKSLVDYIFRWLAMEFVPGYRAANAPEARPKKKSEAGSQNPVEAAAPGDSDEPTSDAMTSKLPSPPQPAAAKPKKSGNGHGPRLDPDTAKPFDYVDDAVARQQSLSDEALEQIHSPHQVAPEADPESRRPAPNLRLAIVADPLEPAGHRTAGRRPRVRRLRQHHRPGGTCYKCLNCGNSMGCS